MGNFSDTVNSIESHSLNKLKSNINNKYNEEVVRDLQNKMDEIFDKYNFNPKVAKVQQLNINELIYSIAHSIYWIEKENELERN